MLIVNWFIYSAGAEGNGRDCGHYCYKVNEQGALYVT